MIRKSAIVLLIFVTGLAGKVFGADSLSTTEQANKYVERSTTIDPEIMKKFPRWAVCEPELKIQIRRAFVLAGYDKSLLDQDDIEVIAIPKPPPDPEFPEPLPYELLHISCGDAGMGANGINQYLRSLEPILAGEVSFVTNDLNLAYKRDYCFEDIPPEQDLTAEQSRAIVDFLEPTNVYHAFTISLFEQTLKVGNTGFWLKNIFGTDEIGYPFWSPGEAKVVLKRPLYNNVDPKTRRAIPHLIDAYLGIGYHNHSGKADGTEDFSWIPERRLNIFPGGKVIGGLDFSFPMHPQVGLHINAELPLRGIDDEDIDYNDFYMYPTNKVLTPQPGMPSGARTDVQNVIPVLRATGQISLFYNYWFGEDIPENFLRLDAGISYQEVREMGYYDLPTQTGLVRFLTPDYSGLKTYKPNEIGDWIYLKAEYRNSRTYPFSISLQYSNQILLSRVYLPIFSEWLLLEAKYATPLRGVRPFETDNFFMVSPVIRITI